jgi:hypothetical protein
MKYLPLVVAGLIGAGCGRGKASSSIDAPAPEEFDAAGGELAADTAAEVPALVLPPECENVTSPPVSLVCTGLYADVAAKLIAPGVAAYAPAVPLWSDGAEKQRWISLPPGTTIDNSDPNEWIFPVGTRAWKEFSSDGHRVETRLWHKVRSNYWVNATYAWNADETEATRTAGGDIPFGGDGGTYHIPTKDECEKCHRGRTEFLLGFDQVGLGLAGATGLNLEALVAAGRLTVPPASTTLTIGDDGTGLAAPALGWLHSNCGTTCHNSNSNATAFAAGMRVRLDANQLDGRSVLDFDALRTTVGVVVLAPAWRGQVRILPGDPENSLLYHLISNRGTGNQMPPIASRAIDLERIPWLLDWIARMPPLATPPDAGALGDAANPDADDVDVGDDAGVSAGDSGDAGQDDGA